MITVEQLKRQFGVRHLKDRGPCIVIPKGKFNIDWEDALRAEGVGIEFNVDLPGGDRCTLLKLSSEHLEERIVYTPSPKKHLQPPSPWQDPERRWKPEEDAFLIELWNKRLARDDICAEVLKKFPNRTKGVIQRLNRLKAKGKIAPRFVKGRGKRKEIKESKEGMEASKRDVSQTSPKTTQNDLPSSSGAHTPTSTLKASEDSPELVKILNEIRDFLKPKSWYFDYVCPHCNYAGFVDDAERIWRFCPVCGKLLIVWNVEA